MAAEYMHIGIPITNKKPGMVYNEGAKFWVSNVDDYDYKIEYLKFEEGTPFPEEIHRNPHVAYRVDDLQKYINFQKKKNVMLPLSGGITFFCA